MRKRMSIENNWHAVAEFKFEAETFQVKFQKCCVISTSEKKEEMADEN